MKGHVYNFLSPMKQVGAVALTSFVLMNYMFYAFASVSILFTLVLAAIEIAFTGLMVYYSDVFITNMMQDKVDDLKKPDIQLKAQNLVKEVVREAKAKNPKFLGRENENDINVFVYKDMPRNLNKFKKSDFNAFACGVRKGKKAVYISQSLYTLLENDPKALKAVIAHELQHISKSHVLINGVIEMMMVLVHKLSEFAIINEIQKSNNKNKHANNDNSNKDKDNEKVRLVVSLFSYTFSIVMKIFGVAYISRLMEFDADNHAVKLGYGKDLVRGLSKLNAAHHDTKIEGLNVNEVVASNRYETVLDRNIAQPGFGRNLLNYLGEIFSSHPSLKARAQNVALSEQYNNDLNSDLGIISSASKSAYYTFWSGCGMQTFWRNENVKVAEIKPVRIV
ncbi:MAG: M48 family metalloprotease [Alphaproteobacteria bacterium]|nr:M48 family metalloprotease [Alphaproteobacteria bacterium]OJV16013.1 MAG: hypothetical protein BGO27_04105 [Alphaproteobacteria bacterium 33-17]